MLTSEEMAASWLVLVEGMDDWGVDYVYTNKKYHNFFNGAREAYFDYQGSRVLARFKVLPAEFHYSFQYGNASVFVMDKRYNFSGGRPPLGAVPDQ